MTSFTINWNDTPKNDSLDELERLKSRPLPAFLRQKPGITERKASSLLTPIGDEKGKMGRVVSECGDKKKGKDKSKKTSHVKKRSALKGEVSNLIDGITTPASNGSARIKQTKLPQKLSIVPVLGNIKKCREPVAEPVTDPMRIRESRNRSLSGNQKCYESLSDNQRRHESLIDRVKIMISSRVNERPEMAHGKAFSSSGDYHDCTTRDTSINSRNEQSIGGRRGHHVDISPISDANGHLMPRPPEAFHVVLANRVYEYRKRRFKFAALRKKRTC